MQHSIRLAPAIEACTDGRQHVGKHCEISVGSLIVGYYRGKDLVYVARVRNGFVPASRRQVFEKIRSLASQTMPFVNLPDTHKSRWGDELTAEKMKECVEMILS